MIQKLDLEQQAELNQRAYEKELLRVAVLEDVNCRISGQLLDYSDAMNQQSDLIKELVAALGAARGDLLEHDREYHHKTRSHAQIDAALAHARGEK
jgi:hypothetical protein